MPKTIKEIFDNKKTSFSALWARYDTDKDLVYMADYVLKNAMGQEVPKDIAISVTLNRAANQARIVSRKLMKAERQIVIEGKKNNRAMNDKETHKIESFVTGAFDQADDRLKKKFMPNLKTFAASHLVVRGSCGRRVWSYLKDDSYIPDILNLDMRYVVYEIGKDGLKYAGYTCVRSGAAIADEYAVEGNIYRDTAADYAEKDEEDITLTVIYDDGKEYVYVETSLISEKKHDFGYPPIVIQPVGAGFMLMDSGYLEHWGESILEMNRKLYEEENRQASIEQSLAMESLLPGYIHEKLDATRKTADYPSAPGDVTPIVKGETLKLAERPDLNNAFRFATSRITGAIQQAGVNDTDLGNTDMSAVAITAQTEIRDQSLSPFLEALAGLDEQTATMLIDQYKTGGYKADIGLSGKKGTITIAELDGDYTVRFIHMSKDKKQEIANLAMAQAAKAMGLPDEYIVRDVMKYDNPGELLAMIESAKAEQDDPIIGIVRRAHALVDEAEGLDTEEKNAKLIESMLLTDTAVNQLRQRYMPQPAINPQNNETKPSDKITGASLVPLLGGGKMTGRPQEPAEVK